MAHADNTTVFTISDAGVASGRRVGQAKLTAVVRRTNLSPLQVTRSLLVLVPGTFKLSGVLSETDNPGVRLPGVTVTIESGVLEGAAVSTDANGVFAFYGAQGPTRLRFSGADYQPRTLDVLVEQHQVVSVGLSFSGQRASAAGLYTLRVIASPACAGQTVAGAARSYTAEVMQGGLDLSAVLSGADFASPAHFSGRLEADRLRIQILAGYSGGFYYSAYPSDLLERVTPSTVFHVWGNAALASTPTGFAGDLDGGLYLGPPLRAYYQDECRRPDHRIELVRR